MSTDIATTIEQARGGDMGAFSQIVRQYQSLVSGVVYSATGDFHKSEDFTQETFLIAWQKLGELQNGEHLAGWLCTIARNLVHRAHRKPTLPTEPLTDNLADLAGTPVSPDTELLRREQSEFVWSAIGEMEEPYRETLVLYYRSEQSVREIALATDSTEEAVRQRLVRARKSLKSKLEEMVGSILTNSAPGEHFTLTVMAAVGATMLTTTGKAVAATTGAVAGTAIGAKTTGSALGIAAIWSMLASVACEIMLNGPVVAWYWAKVRNTPTLRARQFRVYTLFRDAVNSFLYLIAFGLAVVITCLAFPLSSTAGDNMLLVGFTFLSLLAIPSMVYLWFHFAFYRRLKGIIENDLGLLGERVESRSYQQAEKKFFFSVIFYVLYYILP